MRLKIYAWEHRVFRDMYDMHLLPHLREKVIFALAKLFGINLGVVQFNRRRNGMAYSSMGLIQLPKVGCPVGLAVHELAHLYNYQKNGQRGHHKSFKQALIKLMVETKYALPKILKEDSK